MSSRNLITPEVAKRARVYGGYTFNAMPPKDYDGPMMVFAAVRLGDHAHVEIESGRWLGPSVSHRGQESGAACVGLAGRIVLRWHEWVAWRDNMDTTTPYRIADVERPTAAVLDRYMNRAPSDAAHWMRCSVATLKGAAKAIEQAELNNETKTNSKEADPT
jgi:hypothetical protein